MLKGKQPTSKLRRTAGEVKRYRMLMRTIPVIIGFLAAILIITYVITILYNKYGSFTVTVNKFDAIKYSLQLSETRDFYGATSRLNSKASKNITNISTSDLPLYLDELDGEHNGANYVAYTFYCRNCGTNFITYEYDLYITNMSLGVQHAARVRLYVNGVYTDYAFPALDGSGPEPGTTAFMNEKDIVIKQITDFGAGDVTKYTVVIWLEGDDPECIDNVLGGEFKVDMSMTVVEVGDVDPTPQDLSYDTSGGGIDDTSHEGHGGNDESRQEEPESNLGGLVFIPIAVVLIGASVLIGRLLYKKKNISDLNEVIQKGARHARSRPTDLNAIAAQNEVKPDETPPSETEAQNNDIDSSAQQEGAPTDKGDDI